MKIDGTQIAAEILKELKLQVESLKNQGINPTLSIILIGDNKSSESYIKQKEIKAKEAGIDINLHKFESITQTKLVELIKKLNNDPKIHGIIVQRPLPGNINREVVTRTIDPEKDVDGFSDESPLDAPVALAVIEILRSVGITDLNSRKIVVLGKGETAGNPIIKLLDKMELDFEVIDSKTPNPNQLIKNADIIISAVGEENVINPALLNKNQILIGVGLFTKDGKLKGDYDTSEVEGKVKYFTPTIGGVGPVNVALLMKNLIKAVASYAALANTSSPTTGS